MKVFESFARILVWILILQVFDNQIIAQKWGYVTMIAPGKFKYSKPVGYK
ncbi:MAG: hypothetical protein IPO72_10875 [Saprospiraceae bacterium]|nr:hypothetical protein [Candidatus Vicinibacter affinis]